MKGAKSIEEQIVLLKSRGIIIENEEKVKEILLDIGYYHLGFYTYPFEKTYPQEKGRDHIYKEGTTFMDVLYLYYFDFNLRNILLKYITRIEANFRTKLTYIASIEYKETNIWFSDTNIMNEPFVTYFTKNICTKILIQNNSALKRHKNKYKEDKFPPAWKLMECLTFGNLIRIFNSFNDEKVQEKIASQYDISCINTFQNYIDTIRRIRNICAHGSVLYDMILNKGVIKGPAGKIDPDYRSRLKSALNVVFYFLNEISTNRANDIHKEIEELLKKLKKDNSKSYDVVRKCSGLE